MTRRMKDSQRKAMFAKLRNKSFRFKLRELVGFRQPGEKGFIIKVFKKDVGVVDARTAAGKNKADILPLSEKMLKLRKEKDPFGKFKVVIKEG